MKRLGQHFLKSKSIVFDIIKAADLDEDDIVLEVGPGKGILTGALIEKAKKVIAVEKDRKLVEYLIEKFKSIPKSSDRKKVEYSNLEIIHDDILKFDPRPYSLVASGYKIVANIPYYITSHFLRKFLESDFQPEMMILMVQKEVADRIMGKPAQGRGKNKESILSISIKAYGEPKIIKKVPARYFSPQPKVNSAILKINNISKDFFKNCAISEIAQSEKQFFDLVRKGFSHKRKLLKNNLKMLNTECRTFTFCGISEKARAENLSLENWKCVYEQI